MPTTTKVEKTRVVAMVPTALVKQGKHYAVDQDMDFQDVVARALAQYLERATRRKGAA